MDLPETMHDFLLVFLGSGLLLGSLGVILLTNPIFSAFSLGLVLLATNNQWKEPSSYYSLKLGGIFNSVHRNKQLRKKETLFCST
ncbi:hypothetical protein KIW84_054843 [Lathyrus oleraceus]|uniref:Uncharacterized protein n=1 Tax=Pisum sativum TaxID=3888 RepID=A0A9D4WWH9_PEA|nr:hypothetical protein KIW84_054843 [Pisum sativum]